MASKGPAVTEHTHPINNLPNELLGLIFLFYNTPSTSESTPTFTSPPLLLLLISHRWHAIARTLPPLWSPLTLTHLRPRGPTAVISSPLWLARIQSLHRRNVALKSWLERLGPAYPLSLSLSSDEPLAVLSATREPTPASEPLFEMMEIILPHVLRCRKLHICLPVPQHLAVTSLFAFGMPMLEELDLQRGVGEHVAPHPLDLTKCPRLRRLQLDIAVTFEPPLLALPSNDLDYRDDPRPYFPNLQFTELRDSLSTAFSILSNAPSLTRCILVFRTPSPASSSPSSSSSSSPSFTLPLTLPLLTTLIIGASERINPAPFFSSLHAPSLHTLTLDLWFNPRGAPWPHLHTLLLHSHPPLQSLKLSELPNAHNELVDALRLLPSLKSLSLHQTRLEYADILALTDRRYGGEGVERVPLTFEEREDLKTKTKTFEEVCCPMLEKLTLQNCGTFEVSMIQNLIITRARGHKAIALRSLDLVGVGFDMNALMESKGVRRCVEEGLNFVVSPTW